MEENMTNNLKIGIVGGGAVGKAIAAFYHDVKIYDKYTPVDPIGVVADMDYIFVAVPTPFDEQVGKPVLAEMDDALATLSQNLKRPGEQIVIIKSTVPPGTTYPSQENFPSMNFIFNPELLTEKSAVEDFAHPDKQLVGFTGKTGEFADQVMAMLPRAPYEKTMHARAAEIAKYAVNSYYAFKVIFANTFYDLCQKVGADYHLVQEALVHDSRIIDSHFDVMHGGFRGYGGKCLPKDVKTLSWHAAELFSVAGGLSKDLETLSWFAHKTSKSAKFIDVITALNEKLLKNGSLVEIKEKVNV